MVDQSNKSKCAELRQILGLITVSSLFSATEIRVQIGTDFQTEFEKDHIIGNAKNEGKERKREKRRKSAKAAARGRRARGA